MPPSFRLAERHLHHRGKKKKLEATPGKKSKELLRTSEPDPGGRQEICRGKTVWVVFSACSLTFNFPIALEAALKGERNHLSFLRRRPSKRREIETTRRSSRLVKPSCHLPVFITPDMRVFSQKSE